MNIFITHQNSKNFFHLKIFCTYTLIVYYTEEAMEYLIEETNFVNVEENDEPSDSYQCNRFYRFIL